jgi:hypothetical protein
MSIGTSTISHNSGVFLENRDYPFLAKEAFSQLTSTLTSSKLQETIQKMDQLERKDECIEQLVELSRTRKYAFYQSLFVDPDFEYYALEAVRQGKISSIQFGTLLYVRSALSNKVKVSDLEVVPLFNGKKVNPRAWQMIERSFLMSSGTSRLNRPNIIQAFFDRMLDSPESEQFLVLIPDHEKKTPSIRKRLEEIRFEIFCTVDENRWLRLLERDKRKRMLPSFGMIESLLKCGGKDDLSFELVCGESTAEGLLTAMRDRQARQIGIHCPQIAPLPNSADGYPATPIDFVFHDLYHLWTCRCILPQDRMIYCELADLVNPTRFSDKLLKLTAERLYSIFIDMDFRHYSLNPFQQYDAHSLHNVRKRTLKGILEDVKVFVSLSKAAPRLDPDLRTQQLIAEMSKILKSWMTVDMQGHSLKGIV